MDSAHSENVLASIRASALRGDWDAVATFVDSLRSRSLPATGEALGAYLQDLQETLIVARTARAEMTESLGRINAASGFNRTRTALAPCQNFGESAEF